MYPAMLFIFFVALVIAGAYSFPLQLFGLFVILKRKYRRYLINRHGKLEFQQLENCFRWKALREGRSEELVNRVLNEMREQIVQQRGKEYADKFLGEEEWYE
jgi:hypothetical protein